MCFVVLQSPQINDDFIGCMTRTQADARTYFPARLVLGPAAANDYYVPRVASVRGRRTLRLICDDTWLPVVKYAQTQYARVTHREICLLTQGFKMRMYAAKSAQALQGGQQVYFFSGQARGGADYEEVVVEVVSGASTDTAKGRIVPVIKEASEQEELDAAAP